MEEIIGRCRDAFVEVDRHGIVTEWNPRAEQMLGWARDEVVGRHVTATVLRRDYAERTFTDVPTAYADLLRHARGLLPPDERRELELVHKSGHIVVASGSMFVT
ncbi:MAG: PAS domain S-box protein, partial [Acidimicrobiales bacterium]